MNHPVPEKKGVPSTKAISKSGYSAQERSAASHKNGQRFNICVIPVELTVSPSDRTLSTCTS